MILLNGDAETVLSELPGGIFQSCVTSPPYWGLRDYGVSGQIGLEDTPSQYIDSLIKVCCEIHRLLRSDGTFWLNIGDTYCNSDKWGGGGANTGKHTRTADGEVPSWLAVRRKWAQLPDIKPKDLVGIPWRLSFASQEWGWYLRSDIIWSKPNPMPESVTDRPTRSHEYLFLLTKSEQYYYDHESVKEPAVSTKPSGNGYKRDSRLSFQDKAGNAKGSNEQWVPGRVAAKNAFRGPANREGRDMIDVGTGTTRNLRDVWTINTKPFKGAHFAVF